MRAPLLLLARNITVHYRPHLRAQIALLFARGDVDVAAVSGTRHSDDEMAQRELHAVPRVEEHNMSFSQGGSLSIVVTESVRHP